jgi:dienelactone hydrolase
MLRPVPVPDGLLDRVLEKLETGPQNATREVRLILKLRYFAFFLCALSLGIFCHFALAQLPNMRTTVLPTTEEDLAKPCDYDLVTPSSNAPFHAVFVVFERGRDIQHFYDEPAVREFAIQHHLAMLMPHHCASKLYEDIDVDPGKGIGRTLFAALDQLAEQTNHPELKSVPIVVLGFSGAGSLAGRLAAFAPNRIAAAILANAGQFEPLGLDTIQHSPSSLKIPELILVGSKDDHVGTERGYAYFKKYWVEGAPWLFVTQNDVPHCCVVNAQDLILKWLDGILERRLARQSPSLMSVDRNRGYDAFIRTQSVGFLDHWKLPTSSVAEASFVAAGRKPPRDREPAGWLPSKPIADEWKRFVTEPSHPATSMP